MRGNERVTIPSAPDVSLFLIPMRGNELPSDQSADRAASVFLIPMRGNEIALVVTFLSPFAVFLIPMRGNEILSQ